MKGLFAYNNRFLNREGNSCSFSSGDFDSSPPLSNLGKAQLSDFAQFTGASASIDCEADDGASSPSPESFSADTFAVLGCQDFDDNAEVEFLDGSTSLGTVTIDQAPFGGNHAILKLSAPVTLDTLTASFTAAGSGVHKVGAFWAGLSIRYNPLTEVLMDLGSTGILNRSEGGVGWGFPGDPLSRYPLRVVTRSPLDWLSAFRLSGVALPVLFYLEQRDSTDDLIKLYGYVDEFPIVRHITAGDYQVEARITETI